MFTGIIQSTGVISNIEKGQSTSRISIAAEPLFMDDAAIGDSIAVDGVCLTVVEKGKGFFTADVSKETLKLTTLASAKKDVKVNIEKALKPSGKIGGHIVTGHIDGLGTIKNKDMKHGFSVVEFNIPDELMRQVVKKGSIAVDGISLTVAEIIGNSFIVHLVPHTLKLTTLGLKNIGSKVNIETDIIGKYVERFLFPYAKKSSIDEDFLIKHGFIGED
ncbi:MAG: riboflavin synthase [Deltaproteobacteria bacterium]|nr:riboflavin synthase [Deltaproteobacteria bacterium]